LYAIETFDLTKHYGRGRIKALQNCTLQVESGKIFSLLGPNGAGKTTLIKLLIGIIHPTCGSANILGSPIDFHPMHARIGYLAENHRFPEFLTGDQVLYYYGKMSGLETTRLKERIPDLLQRMNLGEWGRVKIHKYSKGMLQRLGLAQALINDPDLLFLDEPTGSIDPIGRRQIRDLIIELRDQGKTIFLNSHLLSEVERISDEIAILNGGRLLQSGKVEDFISLKEQYQLTIANGHQNIFELGEKLNITISRDDQQYVITVADHAQLNRFIDALRREDIIIQAIIPRKITLEDFFIEVIRENEGGGS